MYMAAVAVYLLNKNLNLSSGTIGRIPSSSVPLSIRLPPSIGMPASPPVSLFFLL